MIGIESIFEITEKHFLTLGVALCIFSILVLSQESVWSLIGGSALFCVGAILIITPLWTQFNLANGALLWGGLFLICVVKGWFFKICLSQDV